MRLHGIRVNFERKKCLGGGTPLLQTLSQHKWCVSWIVLSATLNDFSAPSKSRENTALRLDWAERARPIHPEIRGFLKISWKFYNGTNSLPDSTMRCLNVATVDYHKEKMKDNPALSVHQSSRVVRKWGRGAKSPPTLVTGAPYFFTI